MNRIHHLFRHKTENILSVYFTAGYPKLESTEQILIQLEKSGVDLVEIGIPFSDPVADGPVIQESSQVALENGITLSLIFEQLKGIRNKVKIPLILMGYVNPILQYGIENFCNKAGEIGIDGVIIPDLPFNLYERKYKKLFEKNNLLNINLITPRTSSDRLKEIDKVSSGFMYMVSSSSTTGTKHAESSVLNGFAAKIEELGLKTPRLIGFGISDKKTFDNACKFSSGAIIGTAFIKAISESQNMNESICNFIKQIREQ